MRLVRPRVVVFLLLAAFGVAAGLVLRPAGSARAGRAAAKPELRLTARERAVWRPLPIARDRVPVLLYHGIGPPEEYGLDGGYAVSVPDFAKQVALLEAGAYETITLRRFRRFVAGEDVDLPPHPLLLTFDDALAGSIEGADAVLREHGWTATMFVDVGAVDAGRKGYASWEQLREASQSGRWDLQLHAGHGHHNIVYDARGTTGPYYAYRIEGSESVAEWWHRVRDDVEWGEGRLRAEIPGYERLAFAPPYGNFGQLASNDKRVGPYLGSWLRRRFGLVFVQEPARYAQAGRPVAPRLQVTRRMPGGDIHAWLERELVR